MNPLLPYVIGIDGGGTKTEAVVLGTDEQLLVTLTGKATNQHAIGFDSAMQHLRELIQEVWSTLAYEPKNCIGITIGLAGVDTAEEKQKVLHALDLYMKQLNIHVPIWISNDAEIGLMATLGKQEGIVAISGTGSIVYGITSEGHKVRVGGWGHLLGDQGSGYQIGLASIRAVMSSYDGTLSATLLTKLVIEAYQLESVLELKSLIYAPHITKQDIASFARICIVAAEQQDECALRIIEQSASELASQATALIHKHPSFTKGDLVLSGSIFMYSPTFTKCFETLLNESFTQLHIHKARRTPAFGAALLALSSAQLK
ncbi:Glucosamine kinase GspK [compost metagenome]